jgi:hypothetical protein
MVQRTNAARGGRESVSAMKGEVESSILSGSTIPVSASTLRRIATKDIGNLCTNKRAWQQASGRIETGLLHTSIGR